VIRPLLVMAVYDWFYVEKLKSYLNLRMREETKGLYVEYQRMERVRVDKKIFGALQW
jgi:DNA-dependent RNA polymerase auxiliary subunit epsilon